MTTTTMHHRGWIVILDLALVLVFSLS